MIRLSRYASILLAALALLILVRCGKDSPTRPQSISLVPARITITPVAPTLTETGQSTKLYATVVDQNDAAIPGLNVTWSSSNSSVARVNSEGVVTAQNSGYARISATSGSAVASVNVSVVPTTARIVVTPSMVSLPKLGQTQQLNAGFRNGNNEFLSGGSVNWTSSDPKLATVSASGVVTALSRGTVQITATSGSLSTSIGVSIMTSDSDKAILIALYNETNGSNWTNNENWLSEAPLEEWHGVGTDDEGRVVELRLVRNNLEGTIPTELGQLDRLQTIGFFGNKLNGPIPAELGQLVNLGTLWLASNDLSGSIPQELGQLGKVWQMSLAGNRLTGSIPSELGQLVSLNSSLFLYGNELSGSIPPELARLTNLRELDLAHNQLTGAIPAELGQLISLTSLRMENNAGLSGALPTTLTNLPLQYLYVGNTALCAPLSTEFQAWLSTIREKDVLNCADPDRDALIALFNGTAGTNWTTSTNWLSYEPLDTWHGVTADNAGRVNELNLMNNNLNGSLPSALGGLTELNSLNLAFNTALYGPLPRPMTDLNLQSLILNGTNLCSPVEEPFTTWLQGIPNKDVSDCTDLHPDWNAMVAFYYGTDGTNWTTNTSWLSTTPMSEWFGVTTNAAGRVIGLSLESNNLNGTVPSGIAGLTELSRLDLASNGLLSGPLSRAVTHLNLTTLNLSGTLLCVPPDIEFQNWLNSISNRQAATCTDPRPDWDALVALYNATNGPNWTNSENWLSDAPFDQWHGVVTGTGERVLHLGLRNNNLSGSIPMDLDQLTNLTGLNLSNNELTGTIPPELGQLTNLNTLWLNRNKLSGTIPLELGQLTNLTGLYLANNELTGTIPPELGQLTNLNYLSLAYSNLSGSIPAEIGQLTNLSNLDLSGNSMSGTIPPELGQLTNLTGLNLSNNELTGTIPPELGQLTNLNSLWLNRNMLSGTIPLELGRLTNLTGLNLANNELTGTIPPELGQLTNLTGLYLSDNSLTGSIPSELAQLTNLIYLYLENNDGLCASEIPEILMWLASIENASVLNCSDLDFEAMTAFYNATGGMEWSNNENWLSDSPLGDWHGITTDKVGRVSGINLMNNNLNGTLPFEISDLANLRTLNLASNTGLIGPLPSKLTGLELESLVLDDTFLCAPMDTRFQDWLNSIPNASVATCVDLDTDALTALVELYNSTNGSEWNTKTHWLTQAPLSAWHGVTAETDGRITGLNLSDNNLSGSLPSSLIKLKDLKTIDLSNNTGMTGPLPQSLTRLSIESLLLAGTNLCTPPEAGFQNWLQGVSDTSGLAACSSVNPDRGILVTLYSKTNGKNWTNNTNWLSDEPLNKWYGVSTDANQRVISVSLFGNNLLGTVPAELSQLALLETLSLGRNQLQGPIPPELGNLENLRELSLWGCWISGSIPSELGRLTNLEILNLTRNGTTLTGTLPSELGQLTKLSLLALGGNGFNGPIPREIGQLTKLRELYLWGNGFTGAIPREIGQLAELGTFELSNTTVSGTIPFELGQLANLEVLRLNNNELNGTIPPQIGRLNKLTDLWLHGNELAGTIPPQIGQMTNLEKLRLNNNELIGAIPGDISRMTSLETLEISHNQLADSVPPELGNMTALKVLALAGNTELAGPLPVELSRLDLETLMLGDTQLCAPRDTDFQSWLGTIQNVRIESCAVPVKAAAYLTQATQSLKHPVPLVAGRDALLRVFVTVEEDADVTMPPVRATFYRDGSTVYVADVAGENLFVPDAFEEDALTGTVNVEVPGTVVQPGLELVVAIDPDRTISPAQGIVARIPETGRMSLDVHQLPILELTLLTFLWADGPDLSQSSLVDGLTTESVLFQPTRDLLPVSDFQLSIHPPVWTSIDPVTGFGPLSTLGPELEAIYVLEGRRGHYMGILRPGGGFGGISLGIPAFLSFSVFNGETIAHELGHNLNLYHAPCGGAGGPDPYFPYVDGSIGVAGYDLRNGILIDPETSDFMSYCDPTWISDYSFTRALNYRMAIGRRFATPPMAAVSKGLLLWGGLDQAGGLSLEPAFVVDASPVFPQEDGPYTLTGEREDGSILFTLSFAISEYVDAEGGSFAYILPVREEWSGSLERISLTGPEGFDMIDEESNQYVALMRDNATGEVRGILRDWPDPTDTSTAGRRIPPEPGMEIDISGGIPDPDSW